MKSAVGISSEQPESVCVSHEECVSQRTRRGHLLRKCSLVPKTDLCCPEDVDLGEVRCESLGDTQPTGALKGMDVKVGS